MVARQKVNKQQKQKQTKADKTVLYRVTLLLTVCRAFLNIFGA